MWKWSDTNQLQFLSRVNVTWPSKRNEQCSNRGSHRIVLLCLQNSFYMPDLVPVGGFMTPLLLITYLRAQCFQTHTQPAVNSFAA